MDRGGTKQLSLARQGDRTGRRGHREAHRLGPLSLRPRCALPRACGSSPDPTRPDPTRQGLADSAAGSDAARAEPRAGTVVVVVVAAVAAAAAAAKKQFNLVKQLGNQTVGRQVHHTGPVGVRGPGAASGGARAHSPGPRLLQVRPSPASRAAGPGAGGRCHAAAWRATLGRPPSPGDRLGRPHLPAPTPRGPRCPVEHRLPAACSLFSLLLPGIEPAGTGAWG